jgi:hypothetical protein
VGDRLILAKTGGQFGLMNLKHVTTDCHVIDLLSYSPSNEVEKVIGVAGACFLQYSVFKSIGRVPTIDPSRIGRINHDHKEIGKDIIL